MRKAVQILLLAAVLLPLARAAREETLDERKKRITRKYLRERVNVTQSDMYVPSDLPPEDERVLESEQFKQTEDALTREQPATPMPPPPQRRPMPQQQESNWLLEGLDDKERDPYADPFALDKPKGAEADTWTPMESNGDSRYGADRQRNPYERYDPYASRNRYGESPSGTDAARQSPYANQYGTQGNPVQTDRYGRSTDQSQPPGRTLYTPRSYGSSPDSGLLGSPFPQLETPSGTDAYRRPGTPRETPGYKPYTSPYQTRQQQRSQQSPYGTQRQQRQEYIKPDAFKQWKQRNKTWDPTQDDAYTDDLMRQNRR